MTDLKTIRGYLEKIKKDLTTGTNENTFIMQVWDAARDNIIEDSDSDFPRRNFENSIDIWVEENIDKALSCLSEIEEDHIPDTGKMVSSTNEMINDDITIKSLQTDLNTYIEANSEILKENSGLRKRLGIPDTEVITVPALSRPTAKESLPVDNELVREIADIIANFPRKAATQEIDEMITTHAYLKAFGEDIAKQIVAEIERIDRASGKAALQPNGENRCELVKRIDDVINDVPEGKEGDELLEWFYRYCRKATCVAIDCKSALQPENKE